MDKASITAALKSLGVRRLDLGRHARYLAPLLVEGELIKADWSSPGATAIIVTNKKLYHFQGLGTTRFAAIPLGNIGSFKYSPGSKLMVGLKDGEPIAMATNEKLASPSVAFFTTTLNDLFSSKTFPSGPIVYGKISSSGQVVDTPPPRALNWFARHKVWTVILVLVALLIIGSATSGNKSASNSSSVATSSTPPTAQSAQPTPTATPKVATRQVTGKAVTLGAGTFTGGKDVATGLYDVTTLSGQSGNFQVSGTDSYNEILGVSDGQGVPKIRVQISNGDTIQISSLSQVIFTPVATPFAATHAAATLYAGTFTVGQDVGAGRYVAAPGSGQSGNFQVSGADSYNEILGGDSSMGGVPSLTVNLTNGDVVTISSLSQVTLSPSN